MLHLQNVDKEYSTRRTRVKALDGVNLTVAKGQFVVVSGPSGCGKTTLLMTVGGMLRPTRGKVIVGGSDLYDLGGRERSRFRGRKIGFVFQTYHLVPYLSVLENVVLAGPAAGQKADSRRAEELLDRFGMSDRLLHKPSQLSAGERQRAAIARALFNDPEMILADEPTGNLDTESSAFVLKYLSRIHEAGRTVILATHDRSIGDATNVRKISMSRGCLTSA